MRGSCTYKYCAYRYCRGNKCIYEMGELVVFVCICVQRCKVVLFGVPARNRCVWDINPFLALPCHLECPLCSRRADSYVFFLLHFGEELLFVLFFVNLLLYQYPKVSLSSPTPLPSPPHTKQFPACLPLHFSFPIFFSWPSQFHLCCNGPMGLSRAGPYLSFISDQLSKKPKPITSLFYWLFQPTGDGEDFAGD